MSDQKAQAKIPLKKADGTTVFLTMEEFRAYKAQTSAAKPLPHIDPISTVKIDPASNPKKLDPGEVEVISVSPTVTPITLPPIIPPKAIIVPEMPLAVDDLPPLVISPIVEAEIEKIPEQDFPMIIGEQALSTTTPVVDIFVEEARATDLEVKETKKVWKAEDHASLLDEKLDEETISPVLSVPEENNADAVLALIKKQLPLQISKDIQGRFDSLLLSRIRGVRTELDFEQYAKSPKEQGGLGLDEDQTRLVLAVLTAAQKIAGSNPSVSRSSTKTTSGEKTPQSINPIQNTITPPSPTSMRRPTAINVTASHISQNAKISGKDMGAIGKKTMIQDVVGVQMDRRTMGPVEEIEYFSLVDFRRLSPKTENAREILRSKFMTIQEESYILFLDAREAWIKSPLYKIYQNAVIAALDARKPITEIITAQGQSITLNEFYAIIEINHFLG